MLHLDISNPGLAAVFYLALGALAAYCLGLAVYNRYFHPLAGFPGPVMGSLTEWYLVYVICSVPTYGLELHRRYGMGHTTPLLPSLYLLYHPSPTTTGQEMTGFRRDKRGGLSADMFNTK